MADPRSRRTATDDEFRAIQEYLKSHDFNKREFTVNGKTYQLTGDGAMDDPWGGRDATEINQSGNNTALATRSWGLADADGTVLQRDGMGQVSDVGVTRRGTVRYGQTDGPLDLTGWDLNLAQADNSGSYRKFWQFAAVAGGAALAAGAGAGAAGGTAAGGTSAGGTTAAAAAGSLSATEALQLALLAGTVSRGSGGGGSGNGTIPPDAPGPGLGTPDAPPAPKAGLGFDPIALFQANRIRNQTDLNPTRVRPLVAMGNTLLGA